MTFHLKTVFAIGLALYVLPHTVHAATVAVESANCASFSPPYRWAPLSYGEYQHALQDYENRRSGAPDPRITVNQTIYNDPTFQGLLPCDQSNDRGITGLGVAPAPQGVTSFRQYLPPVVIGYYQDYAYVCGQGESGELCHGKPYRSQAPLVNQFLLLTLTGGQNLVVPDEVLKNRAHTSADIVVIYQKENLILKSRTVPVYYDVNGRQAEAGFIKITVIDQNSSKEVAEFYTNSFLN